MSQRPIKFRRWDGRRMIHNPICNDIGVSEYIDINDVMQRFEDTFVAIMQFTGLKDKNSREIFEGDIVKSPDKELAIIKWNDEEFCYQGALIEDGEESDNCWSGGFWEYNEWKVIGNIYSNPELIK